MGEAVHRDASRENEKGEREKGKRKENGQREKGKGTSQQDTWVGCAITERLVLHCAARTALAEPG
jgi:hypothetical protein